MSSTTLISSMENLDKSVHSFWSKTTFYIEDHCDLKFRRSGIKINDGHPWSWPTFIQGLMNLGQNLTLLIGKYFTLKVIVTLTFYVVTYNNCLNDLKIKMSYLLVMLNLPTKIGERMSVFTSYWSKIICFNEDHSELYLWPYDPKINKSHQLVMSKPHATLGEPRPQRSLGINRKPISIWTDGPTDQST